MLSSQKVVLVTGCSSGGIGATLCHEFAARGCVVYATARRVDAMPTFDSPLIKSRTMDVTKELDIQKVVQEVFSTEGKLDVVVNNAGLLVIGPLIDFDIDHVKAVYDTNTFGALRVAKAVIPAMTKHKIHGLIINVGSISGEIPSPWSGLYCSSKAALISLTEVLGMECRPFNIRVMLISPGSVRSNIVINARPMFHLAEGSLYSPFLQNIIHRMNYSQGPNSMPRDQFARAVVTQALKPNPPTYMSIGGSAFFISILKWLPRALVLLLMWHMFSRKM